MNIGLNMQRASDLLLGISIYVDPTKSKIIDLAHSAMVELCKMGVEGKPLWQPHEYDNYETLNDIEYLRQFGQVDATLREIVKLIEVGEPQILPGFGSYQSPHPTSKENLGEALQIEASRDTTYIKMIPINLVELLMDVNQWSRAFYNIVSRATILGTFSDGVEGTYDGKLHVMSAEFHLPTPVVPTRECYFARYSKQLSNDTWAVVDVSLEKFFPSPSNKFRKRPSGCLITRTHGGYSEVTWIEHVEADHSLISNLFKPLVTGLAFGATRWLDSIVRHIEWSETLKATKLVADDDIVIPETGRTSFLKLADRMMRSFCANVSGTTGTPWIQFTPFLGSTNVRIMAENNMEGTANKPCGRTVVFTTTLFLNVSPNRLFNFLRHEKSRKKQRRLFLAEGANLPQFGELRFKSMLREMSTFSVRQFFKQDYLRWRKPWDILSRELTIREFAHMVKGDHPENRVSLLRASTSGGKTEIFYLQESYTDSSAAYVVYAPLDESALMSLAKGSNPDNVIALPSGFAIIPGGLPRDGERKDIGNAGSTGSLLTVAFNLIDKATDSSSIPPESFETISRVITETVTAIKDAMEYHSRLNNWAQD